MSNIGVKINQFKNKLKEKASGFINKLAKGPLLKKLTGKDDGKPGSSGQNDTADFKKYLSANPSKHKVTEARVLAYQDDKPNALDLNHAKQVAEGLETLENKEALKLEDGQLSFEDAQEVASSVQSAHSAVFRSVVAQESGDTIRYEWTGSRGGHAGAKKKSSSPPKLEVGDLIKIDGYGQRLFEVKTLNSATQVFRYAEVKLDLGDEGDAALVLDIDGPSGTLRLEDYDKPGGWKKYNPNMKLISSATLALWNQKDEWSEYSNARIVLNYRQHKGQRNKLNYQWHHIHEKNARGPNSVTNLVSVTEKQNSDFNVWFMNSQRREYVDARGVTKVESTGSKKLRNYLDAINADHALRMAWGLECMNDFRLKPYPKNTERGKFQEGGPK